MSREGALSAVRVAVGSAAHVHELPHGPLRARLAHFGLVPGARVEIVAQRPAMILRVGSTTLALEPEVGAEILLEPAS